MKRTCLTLLMLFVLCSLVFAQDSKEALVLKRDLAQERVWRISAELEVLRTKFSEGQVSLQAEKKNLDALNATLKAMEAEKEKKK